MTASKKAGPRGLTSSRAWAETGAPDIDAPDARWADAISRWLSGDTGPFSAAISEASLELTSDAREFIAALAEGRIKRERAGRPTEYEPWVERSIVAAVFAEHERALGEPRIRGGSPQDRAFERVAKSRSTTPGAVRGLVSKLRAKGWTLELWQQWGRPDFKTRK